MLTASPVSTGILVGRHNADLKVGERAAVPRSWDRRDLRRGRSKDRSGRAHHPAFQWTRDGVTVTLPRGPWVN